MVRLLGMILSVILTSCFIFPFEFTFLPGANTKMIMAAVGLVIVVIQSAKNREGTVGRAFMLLSLMALLVSLFAFMSTVINHTKDYTYATYFISMWVWLGGAYALVSFMRLLHDEVNVETVCTYMIAVCVVQCILALMIDSNPSMQQFVQNNIAGFGFVEMTQMGGSSRLYGIGCGLDVAGGRFAAVLIMIAFVTAHLAEQGRTKFLWAYMVAFGVIVLVGNMIARTTIVGVPFAIVVWILSSVYGDRASDADFKPMWMWIGTAVVAAIVISVIMYETNVNFYNNVRFAFEGFFSLAEKGHWETNSNNILKGMVIFPETLHTWLVGDGYMENPYWRDENYIGSQFNGFYMQTDIGYLRFIFYFGLVGLLAFTLFFVMLTFFLSEKHPGYKWMFICMLLLNLIVWMKVSTDLFVMFAAFLCLLPQGENLVLEDEDSI